MGEKENITVLLIVNAYGDLAVMMSPQIAQNANRDWALAHSDKGWMTSEIFFEYISNTFLPWLKKNNFELPIVLFCDGHTSHVKYWLAIFCRENGIILIIFYPNATHVIQPLDTGARFSTGQRRMETKSFWFAKTWNQDNEREFSPVFYEECLDTSLNPDIVRNAFREAGIYPFDPNNVCYEKLVTFSKSSPGEPTVTTDTSDVLVRRIEKQLQPEILTAFKKNIGSTWLGAHSVMALQ